MWNNNNNINNNNIVLQTRPLDDNWFPSGSISSWIVYGTYVNKKM